MPGADEPADAVQQARTRARQRLIGAALLLLVGVIGFPLVFETQPRPIALDIPIEIPRKDGIAPLVMPPARAGESTVAGMQPPEAGLSGNRAAAVLPAAAPHAAAQQASSVGTDVITESRAQAGRELGAAAPAVAGAATNERRTNDRGTNERSANGRANTERTTERVAPVREPAALNPAQRAPVAAAPKKPAPQVAAATPAAAPADAARALLDRNDASPSEGVRFVVQVGAFAEAGAARQVRERAEKLGLKTYTQVAQTASGSRIRVRVGPFATREEAERALAKVRAGGLSAVVLTL